MEWSHWDRWYCVVCVKDFAGDWEALAERLADRSGRLHSGPNAEAKLSHLDEVVARLAAADLDAEALAGSEPVDSKVVARARRKVLDQGLSGRDYTDAMVNTPRRRLRRRAWRGSWGAFPVDPAGPSELLATEEDRDHIAKNASFAVVRDLEATLMEAEQAAVDDPAAGVGGSARCVDGRGRAGPPQ